MRIQSFRLIFAVAFIFSIIFAANAAENSVLLDSLYGKAEVMKAGRQQWQAATKGMRLSNNDMIHVLEKSKARLAWPDGSSTYVSQNSQILINLLQEDNGKKRILSHVTVFFGAAFFLVKKIAPRGVFSESMLRVYTPTAVVSIRGTAFNIVVEPKSGSTAVQVVNGTVQVRNIIKTVSLFLSAPYQSSVLINTDPSAPKALLQADIDTLKSWIPGAVITSAMEKQTAQSTIDYLTISGNLANKCVLVRFTNASSYHGPWDITTGLTNYFSESLRKLKPKLKVIQIDTSALDPIEVAQKDSSRFAIIGSIEVFDIVQHGVITTRADQYNEYSVATVKLRLQLMDAFEHKLLAEEVYSGEFSNKNVSENNWQAVNKLKFDPGDKIFASSILGIAISQAINQASEKITSYLNN